MTDLPKTKWQLKAWCWEAAGATFGTLYSVSVANQAEIDLPTGYYDERLRRAKALYEWVSK